MTLEKMIFIPIIVVCAFICRKDKNVTMLIILYLIIEALNIAIQKASMQWGYLYYLRCIAFDLLFITAIFARRGIAHLIAAIPIDKVQQTGEAWVRAFRHSIFDMAIIGIIFCGMIISTICMIEGFLYYQWLIDTTWFIDNTFDRMQWIVQGATVIYIILLTCSSSLNRKKYRIA
ncbi:hypothetical protein [Algicola sagamiensis]|uniref:hypothetical protein n=1 Tax=Algicola sagamiensis TaxID=163869 RepID=UPI0003698047|nr:hypothetical protein [Algicola sagamiensis]